MLADDIYLMRIAQRYNMATYDTLSLMATYDTLQVAG